MKDALCAPQQYKDARMNAKVTIWNMALGFIGTRTVASDTENTLEAVQCGLYWDSARRQALRDFPWNFAQRRVWLAEIDMPVGYEKQYAYAYAMPEDALQALRLFPEGEDLRTNYADEEAGRFLVVHDAERKGGVIVTNAQNALLSYTADITDVSLFDDLFMHMLARKLAAMVAISLLKNNSQKISELEQLYRASIPNAVQANANEGREKELPDTWLLARSGGYIS